MPWECLNCGKFNNDALTSCEKCLLDKSTATSILSFPTKRTVCDECGHKHLEKTYCHCYRAVTSDDLDQEEDGEESENDSNDGSAEISVGMAKKETVVAVEAVDGVLPLPTPKFLSRIYYMRCNCLAGVPSNSRRFEPLPVKLMVGDIWVKYYEDALELYDNIHNEDHRNFHFRQMADRMPERNMTEEQKEKRRARFAEIMPLVCRFIPLGEIAKPAVASKAWNYGISLYREYIDVRDCVPWQVVRVHEGQVDTVLNVSNAVYSGGDRRVFATSMEAGEVISQIMRDSGDICYLTETDHELFCCSSNGSIRSYMLTHDHKHAALGKTMWEHSRRVLTIMYDLPSYGPCDEHGITGHQCFFYTVSDDRSIRQWSTTRYQMTAAILCKDIRQYSYSCITQSRRHLIAGTTASTIMVFTKNNVCERVDVHACNTPGADKSHCLQVTLRLPKFDLCDGNPPSVTGIVCCGPNRSTGYLWAGDSAGRLLLWEVPDEGLDFVPTKIWMAHSKAITAMANTWRHVITCGDDGFVLLWEISHLVRVRSINIQDWATARGLMDRIDIPRRIKCMHVKEDHDAGGLMCVGTSYGEVVIMSIGVYV